MLHFECDYTEGAIPEIMDRMLSTNMEQTSGYGNDAHCIRAKELIKQACGREDLEIHFMVGGTQTNTTVIASVLRPHQGVIAADSGHINVHETGAIESTGHKVLPLPGVNAKITAEQIRIYCKEHWSDSDHEHIVQPGMVYLSQPTEFGTIYSKQELQEIQEVCREYELCMYVDGARLGYGLVAQSNDVSLKDMPELCDIFYIGGTKVGALFGEAVVICNPVYGKDFRYLMKQHGGMLAKGRLLGIQFETLFENDNYMKAAGEAVRLAMKLKTALAEKGYEFYIPSETNQQFVIMNKNRMNILAEKYAFSNWCWLDEDHAAVRFCTSWATKEENIDALIADL